MKRILSLVLTIALSLTVLTVTASAAGPFNKQELCWLGPAIAIDENGEIVLYPDISEQDIVDIYINNVSEGRLLFPEEDYETISLYLRTYPPTFMTSYRLYWILEDSAMLVIDSDYSIKFFTDEWSLTISADFSQITYKSFKDTLA